MEKKINISDLKIGMRVRIKKNWFSTSLISHSFVIKKQSDIKKLFEYRDNLYVFSDEKEIRKNLGLLKLIITDIERCKIIDKSKTLLAIENFSVMVLSGKVLADDILHQVKSDSLLFRKSVKLLLLSITFGKFLAFDKEKLLNIALSAFLHDLSLSGTYNKESVCKSIIYNHTKKTAEILETANFNRSVIKTILFHHENFDGSGYPYGFSGKQINIEARILRVLDLYVALTSHRNYRSFKYSIEEALRHISVQSSLGKLDPVIVSKFLNFINRGL